MPWLAYVPQMEPIRRELLLDALKFYQKFLDKQSDDPVIRREAALAHWRVGRIHSLFDQFDKAETSFRHAIETLAKSERRGCALGAATALMADWPAVRAVFDRAADRIGMPRPALTLPDQDSIVRVISDGTDGLASERALGFGGEQLLLQNRGLFDLLEARAAARGDF